MSKNKKIVRAAFRAMVFERDNYTCVFCKEPAVDAHHIISRDEFEDGGYFLDNGVSLCEWHHLEAEDGTITVEQIREKLCL